jgi:hypothetical protein
VVQRFSPTKPASSDDNKPERRLQSREDTARQLGGVSIQTVRRLEHQGRLRIFQLTKRGQVFHDVNDVARLIDSVQVDPSRQDALHG